MKDSKRVFMSKRKLMVSVRAGGELGGGVGEEKACEFEGGLVAAIGSGDEAGRVGVGGGSGRGRGISSREERSSLEELAIGVGGGLEEEAFEDRSGRRD